MTRQKFSVLRNTSRHAIPQTDIQSQQHLNTNLTLTQEAGILLLNAEASSEPDAYSFPH